MGGITTEEVKENSTAMVTVRPRDLVPKEGSQDAQPLPPLRTALEEINDKSKGDALAKMIVVIQAPYFLIQLLARVARRLTITKLEIMTLRRVVHILVAQAVQCTEAYLRPHQSSSSSSETNGGGYLSRIMNGSFILNVHSSIVGDGEGLEVLGELNGELELSMNVNLHRIATISSFLTATAFGGIHCITWNTRAERHIWLFR